MKKNNLDQYIARYLLNTDQIASRFLPKTIVTLQWFQWENNVKLCGMNEVLELLKTYSDIKKYKIYYLPEGSIIKSREVVLEIEGPYHLFGKFEGIIDGILSRQSSIATNAYNVIKAAKNKEVVFMGDRSDHYLNQSRDGYAISVGGIKKRVTNAQLSFEGDQAIGTIPHVLIQLFKGDLIKALEAFNDVFPDQKLIALVDFNNDVVSESLKVLKHFQKKLSAVRVDTSLNIVDKSMVQYNLHGVNPFLIKTLRHSLDLKNGKHVKIIVSSGFNQKRIEEFEAQNTPVDIYGVGASLLKINVYFSADAVKNDHLKIAKVGREYRQNPKLKLFL